MRAEVPSFNLDCAKVPFWEPKHTIQCSLGSQNAPKCHFIYPKGPQRCKNNQNDFGRIPNLYYSSILGAKTHNKVPLRGAKTLKSSMLGAKIQNKVPSCEPKHTNISYWEPKHTIECFQGSQNTLKF